jgi:PAS domain S-box-containing protein
MQSNFGLQPHEALNFHRAFEELIHPDDRDAMRAALTQTISRARRLRRRFRWCGPTAACTGSCRAARGLHAEGRAVAMTGVNFDDTERRGAMDRLRENEAQVRRTVEDAPLALCLHADDGEILNLSRHWTELTGYTRTTRRSAGMAAPRLRHRDGEFHEAIERIFGGDHAMVQTDIEILTRNGVPRTWSLAASSRVC